MGTRYETDVLAWSTEQAALLRAGKFSQIDIEHIAEEIEDVGKSEKRELESRIECSSRKVYLVYGKDTFGRFLSRIVRDLEYQKRCSETAFFSWL
ncbi:hypothetical protein J2125_004266 [Erwinia toletana]|uniref:Uncharacterized protein n=1 Tax=Winslowiella toletana TaxID=92490 RepID=A0ABS4PEK9_9GAMM|nr:hypothetical protein [Winslowiella toletana]